MRKIVAILVSASICLATASCFGSSKRPDSSSAASTDTAASNTGSTSGADSTATASKSPTSTNAGSGTTAAASSGTASTKTTSTTSGKLDNTAVPNQTKSITVPLLYGDQASVLLKNPNRGLRMEVSMESSTGLTFNNSTTLVDEANMYSDESPMVVQTYFYLDNYINKDLDSTALNNISSYLDLAKSMGVQVLILFCYSFNDQMKEEPSTAQIQRHIQQLAPILSKYRDVIHAVQAGFIGYWGEWGPSDNPELNTAAGQTSVLTEILKDFPSSLFVQIRYVNRKNLLSDTNPLKSHVGFEDMFVIGPRCAWSTAGSDQYSDLAMQMQFQSANTVNDGEMPWGGSASVWPSLYDNDNIDPYMVAKYISSNHFTTFSLFHDYREGGGIYSMTKWKDDSASESKLNANGLPFAPSWLRDSSGKVLNNTMFTYIQDYLGYYIQASNLKATLTGTSLAVSVNLTNFGFAAPLAMKSCDLVILDQNNKILQTLPACDLDSLQTGVTISAAGTFARPKNVSEIKIGVALKNYGGIGARFANDVPFINCVNVLGVLG